MYRSRESASDTMNNDKSVGVVVLGDVGRSPRMQYHCYSLKREGFRVKLIGYDDTKVSPTLLRDVPIVNVNTLRSLC